MSRQSISVSIVFLCFVANIFSHMDRQILIIFVELIKTELVLNDTAFGLLQGLAFSIPFAFSSLILAYFSDNFSRKRAIAAGIFIWSTATLMCGFAETFTELFIARMGVGLGQALLSPAVYSLLASSYPRSYLGKVTSFYASGSFIGNAIILISGGLLVSLAANTPFLLLPFIGNLSTWRVGFVVAGLIGIFYSIIFLFACKETSQNNELTKSNKVTNKQVIEFLSAHKKMMLFYISGFSLSSMSMFTLIVWGPAYFIRIHQMEPSLVGLMLACSYISANLSGVLISGWLVDMLHSRNIKSAPFLIGVGAALAVALCLSLFYIFSLYDKKTLVFLTFFLAAHFSSYVISPSATVNQLISPEKMRARVYSLFLCVNSITALSIGVTLVGIFNDQLFKSPYAVGTSMALTATVSSLFSAIILFVGRTHYVRMIEK